MASINTRSQILIKQEIQYPIPNVLTLHSMDDQTRARIKQQLSLGEISSDSDRQKLSSRSSAKGSEITAEAIYEPTREGSSLKKDRLAPRSKSV